MEAQKRMLKKQISLTNNIYNTKNKIIIYNKVLEIIYVQDEQIKTRLFQKLLTNPPLKKKGN